GRSPARLPRLAIESYQIAGCLVIGRNHHQRLVSRRRGRIAPVRFKVAQLGLPALLAIEAKGGRPDRALVVKSGIELLAIADERRRSSSVLVVPAAVEAAFVDLLAPGLFSRCPVETKDRLRLCLLIGRFQEDAGTDNDGRSMSPARHGRLPDHVL